MSTKKEILQVQPSPALIVRADTPIRDCIARMQKFSVGSLLIANDDLHEKLIGIFTERDLLKKIHHIRVEENWERPVRTVMTSPLKTLDIENLSDAGQIMIEGGFRHLPIVKKTTSGEEVLLGVISMRDLMRMYVENQIEKRAIFEASGEDPLSIGVMRPSFDTQPSLYESLRKILKTNLIKLTSDELLNKQQSDKIKKMGALILDLDSPEAIHWIQLFKDKKTMPKIPFLVILFNPETQPPAMNLALQKLNENRNIAVFSKPVNITALLYRLTPAIRPENGD